MEVGIWHDPDLHAIVVTYRGSYDREARPETFRMIRDLAIEHPGSGVLVDSRGLQELPHTLDDVERSADGAMVLAPRVRGWAMIHSDPDYFEQWVGALQRRSIPARRFGEDMRAARTWLAGLSRPATSGDDADP